jgi:hypothetical protein
MATDPIVEEARRWLNRELESMSYPDATDRFAQAVIDLHEEVTDLCENCTYDDADPHKDRSRASLFSNDPEFPRNWFMCGECWNGLAEKVNQWRERAERAERRVAELEAWKEAALAEVEAQWLRESGE